MDPIIHTKNVHRIYEHGKLRYHVLNGISLTVARGEFLGIMGKSGAGKSTLLYQLSGLDQPTEGEIVVDKYTISSLSEDELVSFRLNTLGFVFQDYALVPELNAQENVMLPLLMQGMTWKEAMLRAHNTLDSVGLSKRYKNLPAELSGGEQQRVSIARAIAGKPKILFADEPTANLDSTSGKAIVALLTEFHKNGQTIVMVTHEEEYTATCDRVIYLEDGSIIKEVVHAPEPNNPAPQETSNQSLPLQS